MVNITKVLNVWRDEEGNVFKIIVNCNFNETPAGILIIETDSNLNEFEIPFNYYNKGETITTPLVKAELKRVLKEFIKENRQEILSRGVVFE